MPVANLVLAAFLIALAVINLVQAPPRAWWDVEAWWYVPVTAILATLALRRSRPRQQDGRLVVYLLCVLSTFYVLAFAPVPDPAPQLAAVAYWGRVLFQGLGQLSLITLGRSFALFPALHEIKTDWLYRLVRHPVYAAYMLADVCFLYLQFSWWNVAVALGGTILFYQRALIEEQVLRSDTAYQAYMARVRWRFVPGLI